MDNLTGMGVEGSTNTENINEKRPEFAKKNNTNEGQVETIIVPTEVQEVETNPNLVEKKTEVCTHIIDETLIQNKSNKDQELCDNVQQLNLLETLDMEKNPNNQISSAGVAVQKVNISESLSNLLVYGSSSEDSEIDSASSIAESDSDTDENQCSNHHETQELEGLTKTSEICVSSENYREKKEDSSSDSSDNESSDSGSYMGAKNIKQQTKSQNHADGELGLDDLPPVPDLSKLNINLKEGECIHMGNVTSIVDRLVMVQSLPNMPAYDLDTLLFLDEGKQPLGHVYDVMGQVTSPMYVIRFNTKQEIESKGITKGLPIYSAPNTEHTQYVFLKELMKIKGTDASWKGDNEVPVEFVDFSDDETEYTFSKHLNEKDLVDKKRKRNSIERHKMFETAMNLKNKVDTARHKMRDSYEPTPKRYMPQTNQPTYYFHPPNVNQIRQQCSTSYTNFPPPNFTMPPPNFGFMSIGPAMLGMQPYSTQFGHGMPPFPPNSQSFVPPTIPPLPGVAHVLPQPPPPATFPISMPVIPPNVAIMNIPKPIVNTPKPSKPLKSNQNGGVVPKTHSVVPKPRNSSQPKLYMPSPSDYQPPYPPGLGLPKATVPPFNSNSPQNMPTSIPPSFCPPMPPWPFNMARPPHNSRGFQPHYSGMGRPFQKQ